MRGTGFFGEGVDRHQHVTEGVESSTDMSARSTWSGCRDSVVGI